jgi:chromosome segregation ATPase
MNRIHPKGTKGYQNPLVQPFVPLASLDEKIVNELLAEMNGKLNHLLEKIDDLEAHYEQFQKHYDMYDRKIETVQHILNQLNSKMDGLIESLNKK